MSKTWKEYLKYLLNWAKDHEAKEFLGCSPAGFDEWYSNEAEEVFTPTNAPNPFLQQTLLSEASVYELTDELRRRKNIVAVQVWQKEDVEEALKMALYDPTVERIDLISQKAKNPLEDCSHGWDTLSCVISDDLLGPSDLVLED